MKKILFYLLLSALCSPILTAQCFQTTVTNIGNTIIVKVKPTGGDITTGFAAMEYFLRYPNTKTVTWGTAIPNVSAFPGLQLSQQTPSGFATEVGATIVFFSQTLLTFTTSATYLNGVEYEVFRISVSGTGTTNFELVHLDDYLKYWSTMTALDAATERTCDIKFYGTGASATPASYQSFMLNNVALPLELLDFSGKESDKGITLNWKTANERNVSHFVVEKSSGNKADKFIEIGEIKATGSKEGPPQYYSLLDAQASDISYYRLKMVDNDGSFNYSKTITFKTNNTTKESISLYPNPVGDVLNIVLTNSPYKTATVRLMDITGRVLLTQSINSNNADNAAFVLHTDSFTNGVYTAVVTVDDHATMHKVVIAK
jgi:Secretion system C-terminal sorting domain